jgi:hypothetical protein
MGQGLRPTLTKADGLIPGFVPRLEQREQLDHLRARFEACICPLPNLDQPRIQFLLLAFILCFLFALVF